MIPWLILTTLALAQDPDPPPAEEPATPEDVETSEDAEPTEASEASASGRSYTIDVDDTGLGSALDDFAEKGATVAAEDGARLEDLVADEFTRLERPVLFRSRWFVKPLLSWANLDGRSGLRPGLAVGHQWFPVADVPVQLAGETRLAAAAPIGGLRGYSFELTSLAGPWIGPIGFRVGPSLHWDRWNGERVYLQDALLLGPMATLALDAGRVHPWVGMEPAWILLGDRQAWGPVGEFSMMAGVQFALKGLHLGAHGTWRETSAGRLLDIGLTLHVRPG